MTFFKKLLLKVKRKINHEFPRKFLAPIKKGLILEEVILADKNKRNIFFGYHDRTPFHVNSRLVLAHRSNVDKLDIGFFDLKDKKKEFHSITYSTAYSTQQGSMLQWDYLNNTETINFNSFIGDSVKNISFNISNKNMVSQINMPLYCLSNDYKYGLSSNFFRLAEMRPGYGIKSISHNGNIDFHNDGIWLVDRITGKSNLIASYEKISKDLPCKFSDNLYINHLSFSPDSNTIVWFLIDEKKSGRDIYFQGLKLNDEENIINIEQNRLLSHFCWTSNSKIFGINRNSELTWNYTEYDLVNNTKSDFYNNSGFDGHPMFNFKSNKIIIDTTPDPKRFQHLLALDLSNQKMIQIDRLFSPSQFSGPERCDLHPRWSHDSSMISIDTPIKDQICQKIFLLDNRVLDSI